MMKRVSSKENASTALVRTSVPTMESEVGAFLKKRPGMAGILFPLVGLSLIVATLVIVYVLASVYNPAKYQFISQMGSHRPAYFFYAWGFSFSSGLLVPCAYMFYLHNGDKLRCDISSIRRRLNKLSLTTACISCFGLGAQSVYPMGEGNPIHIAFATIFFAFIFMHACITSLMYWNALKDKRVKLPANERFWAYWKASFALITTVFTILTLVVLAYDASFHLNDDWVSGPNIAEWLKQSQDKPKTVWMAGGAVCEYLTVVSMLAYLVSCFHDLWHVKILVVSPPSDDVSTPGKRRRH